jgi:hypothetical protein
MNKLQAGNEIKYRLIKIMLETMEAEGLISASEKETVLKKLINKVKPLIGQLDQKKVGL